MSKDIKKITFAASDLKKVAPVNDIDVANKKYVDDRHANTWAISGSSYTITEAQKTKYDAIISKITLPNSGQLSVNNNRLLNLADAVDPQDAVTKKQLDAHPSPTAANVWTTSSGNNTITTKEKSAYDSVVEQAVRIDKETIDASSCIISNVSNGVKPTDAVNLSQISKLEERLSTLEITLHKS